MKFYLTGLAGAGKSYYGKMWAKEFDLNFYDLDELIEYQSQSTIEEIFRIQNEQGFRKLEQDALLQTETFEKCIIACGGGTPCFYDNMKWMNEHGTTIWLQQTIETIIENLANSSKPRPLLRNKAGKEIEEELQKLLSSRTHYYSQTKFTIDLSEDFSESSKNIFTSHA